MSGDAGTSPMPLGRVLGMWEDVAEAWGLHPAERSALVGGNIDHVEVDGRIATYLLLCGEQRIRLLVEVAPLLRLIVGDDDMIVEWLRTPNQNLAGRLPIDVMANSPEWMRWLLDNVGDAS